MNSLLKSSYIYYIELNDSANLAGVDIECIEKSVKFNEIVEVVLFKRHKNVSFKEIPEIIYTFPTEYKILSFFCNLKYEIICSIRYYYNNVKVTQQLQLLIQSLAFITHY
jgi:hypothetical protein